MGQAMEQAAEVDGVVDVVPCEAGGGGEAETLGGGEGGEGFLAGGPGDVGQEGGDVDAACEADAPVAAVGGGAERGGGLFGQLGGGEEVAEWHVGTVDAEEEQ